ncbi:uncharacterized protein [Apostichopus japonicus]|uniref:uncharacterized protein n=1 Tax=Stichopus japonicus TaxID=307972 RepID=UPI003AB11039
MTTDSKPAKETTYLTSKVSTYADDSTLEATTIPDSTTKTTVLKMTTDSKPAKETTYLTSKVSTYADGSTSKATTIPDSTTKTTILKMTTDSKPAKETTYLTSKVSTYADGSTLETTTVPESTTKTTVQEISTIFITTEDPSDLTTIMSTYVADSTTETDGISELTTKTAVPCPTWIDIGDDQYCLSDIELNWTEAAECCRLPPNNGHLVYIESEDERDQIESFRDALNTYVNRCWIGIEDSINEGEWTYEDGRSPAFVNWEYGEPDGNTGNRGDQDCAFINSDGYYHDAPCHRDLHFICER